MRKRKCQTSLKSCDYLEKKLKLELIEYTNFFLSYPESKPKKKFKNLKESESCLPLLLKIFQLVVLHREPCVNQKKLRKKIYQDLIEMKSMRRRINWRRIHWIMMVNLYFYLRGKMP